MNNSHCTHHKSKWLVYLYLCLQWVTRFLLLHLYLYLYWCISTYIGISHLILISICISTCTCTCDWWYLLSSRFATLSSGYLWLPCYQSAFVITMLPICIAMLPICHATNLHLSLPPRCKIGNTSTYTCRYTHTRTTTIAHTFGHRQQYVKSLELVHAYLSNFPLPKLIFQITCLNSVCAESKSNIYR